MFYVGWNVSDVLLDLNGKQLMTEAFYLYGLMLWLIDDRIPGPVRERIIVAYVRCVGESKLPNLKRVVKLARHTGYTPATKTEGAKRPKNYPDAYFSRFKLPKDVIEMIINRLQQDDVYLQTRAFPSPAHRSTALSSQASMMYIILHFMPDILHKRKAQMREIVDRNFPENWVLGVYMGFVVDLTVVWKHYPAAAAALRNTMEESHLREVAGEFHHKLCLSPRVTRP